MDGEPLERLGVDQFNVAGGPGRPCDRQHVDRLDQVGLPVSVWALKQHDARVEMQLFGRVVAEVGEVELGNADVTASQSRGYT